jgi:SET domain-containing protein
MSESEEMTGMHPHLLVRRFEGKGRGVVARHALRKGDVIDRNPVVVLPPEQVAAIELTVLDDYVFIWGERRDHVAMVLGAISLVSHDYSPNAVYERHLELEELWLVAFRDIAAGEEITINYSGSPTSRIPVWFDVAPPAGPDGG